MLRARVTLSKVRVKYTGGKVHRRDRFSHTYILYREYCERGSINMYNELKGYIYKQGSLAVNNSLEVFRSGSLRARLCIYKTAIAPTTIARRPLCTLRPVAPLLESGAVVD